METCQTDGGEGHFYGFPAAEMELQGNAEMLLNVALLCKTEGKQNLLRQQIRQVAGARQMPEKTQIDARNCKTNAIS